MTVVYSVNQSVRQSLGPCVESTRAWRERERRKESTGVTTSEDIATAGARICRAEASLSVAGRAC